MLYGNGFENLISNYIDTISQEKRPLKVADDKCPLEVFWLLDIGNLSISVGGKRVLNNLNLRVDPGETHVLFGPNGSGKTTLLNAIMGIPRYVIDSGKIVFKGKDITKKSMDERARLGIGMAFQRPPAIRGLKLKNLVRIVNPKADVEGILKKMDFEEFANRDVNRGFSVVRLRDRRWFSS